MYTKEDDIYFCKRLRVLEWLNTRGFRPFATVPDKFNPAMSIWLFKNSPQVFKAVQEYYETRAGERKIV